MICKNNYTVPLFFSLFMAIISSCIFFPGFMSFDSFYQYGQALGLQPLNDAHPPIMAYIWGALCHLVKSPGTLLCFDQIIYWMVIFLFSCAVSTRVRRRVLMIAIMGLWPPLYITSLHLWADAGMMIFLALSVACLAIHNTDERKRWLVMATGALFVASAFRYNAITGVIPLLCYVAWCFAKNFSVPVSAFIKIFGSLFLVLMLGLKTLTIGVRHLPQLSTIFVWDMTAISAIQNKDIIPDYVTKKTDPDFIKWLSSHWNPDTVTTDVSEVPPVLTPMQEKQLLRDWIKAVVNNPRAYVEHRLHMVGTLLNFRHRVYYPYNFAGIDQPNAYGINFTFRKIVHKISKFVFKKETKLIIYRVWPYGMAAIFLTFYCLYRSFFLHKKGYFGALPAITALSGIMIELPLFILAPASDYRYSIWLVFSTILAASLMLSGRNKDNKASQFNALHTESKNGLNDFPQNSADMSDHQLRAG